MLGTIFIFLGSFLVVTWFGTTMKMKKEGTFGEHGGGGAYLWLAIYLGIIITGIFI